MSENALKRLWWVAVGVGGLVILLFWPCVRNGFTHWDDNLYLQEVVRRGLNWKGIQWAFTSTYIYYHPLTWLSHGLDYALWGLNPAGHHATSVGLHAINAILVVLVVWAVTEWWTTWSDFERLLLAGWVGLIFAVHPLQVEAVAWISGRKTLLATTFSLLTVLAYVRWSREPGKRSLWWAANIAYVAALLSKPTAVPLPLVLLLLDWYPLGRRATRDWRALVTEKWTMFALALGCGLLAILGQTGTGALSTIPLTPVERMFVASRSLIFYGWKLIWPAWLSPFYPLGDSVHWQQAEFLVPAAGVAALTLAAVLLRNRWPQILVAWLAYVVLVLPASGLMQAGGQAAADRFAYLPMVVLLILAGGALVVLRRRLSPVPRGLLIAAAGAQLLWLGARTQNQIPIWQDDVTLWQAVIAHYPNSTDQYRFVAQGLIQRGQFADALPYAEEEYQRQGQRPEARKLLSTVFHDITVGLIEHREFAPCVIAARRAVELNPADDVALSAQGLALLKLGRPAEAITPLEAVVQRRADLPSARYNLGCAYARMGRLAEAFQTLQQALADNPKLAEFARRDSSLAELRDQSEFSNRFQNLVGPP